MTESVSLAESRNTPDLPESVVLRIRFHADTGDESREPLMRFVDPQRRLAYVEEVPSDGVDESQVPAREGIDILTVTAAVQENSSRQAMLVEWVGKAADGGSPSIPLTLHGGHVVWRPGRAAVMTISGRMEVFIKSIIDFSYYEAELTRLEREVAESWPELDRDMPLAFQIKAGDLIGTASVGERMRQSLDRRARLARIEPQLQLAGRHLPIMAQQLGNRLREKTRTEERLEALDGQLEVFESVYEMGSQRIGEFQHSRKERRLEWVIIILLAVEVVLILVDLYR